MDGFILIKKLLYGDFATRHDMDDLGWQIRKRRASKKQWCILRASDLVVLAQSKDFGKIDKTIKPFGYRI